MAPHWWRSLRKGISRGRRPALFGLDLTRYTKPRNLEPMPIAKYDRNTSSVKERGTLLLRNLGKSECEMPSRSEADCSRPAFLGRENGDDSASGNRRVSQTRAAQPLRATATISAVPRLNRRKPQACGPSKSDEERFCAGVFRGSQANILVWKGARARLRS
jgi:hypothetical protein